MKGDKQAGQQFLDPASSPLVKAGWKIVSKNWGTAAGRMASNVSEEAF
jgi:hypothetical protein